jgi:hypothetical protein
MDNQAGLAYTDAFMLVYVAVPTSNSFDDRRSKNGRFR